MLLDEMFLRLGRAPIAFSILFFGSLIWSPFHALGQTPILVTEPVDDLSTVRLRGNVSSLARPERDLGAVDDSFPAERLLLVLTRPNEQEQALEQFLRDAHTPGNPSYHAWLTPQEFGVRFGAADSDILALTAWLESHGFTVNKVHPGRIAIEFSGKSGQVREAFHTEIHRYQLAGGGSAYGNSRALEIPTAFAKLVAGISPVSSVRAKPMLRVAGKASFDVKTHEARAEWTYPASNGGVTFELTPADFAVQYDIASMYKGGTTGTGQSIGILSASNVDLSLVQAYQALFGLPASLPTVIIDGNDPGQTSDATEAYLDLEEAGAVAPGAQVVMYTSAGSVLTDPLLTSGLRAVEDNQVSVLSVSYGTCEAELGASGNALWASLWQEAAAQGITVFVSAGDSGSAGCDNPDSQSFAFSGLGVNGLASTPYNVAVGGTDFYYSSYAAAPSVLQSQIGTYWGEASTKLPAVSLLQSAPEQVWNDAFGLNADDGGMYSPAQSTIVGGGGGSSSAALYPASGPVGGYPKPAWQNAPGVPADQLRDLPDVSLFAGDGTNLVEYPICAEPGDCINTGSTGAVMVTNVGGTSASAPAMAAIQALIDQATKSRQGQADIVYYALANKTATVNSFHDVTVGGNEVPCFAGSAQCVLAASGPAKGNYAENGFAAGKGYDQASGLGSVDVAKLIANWSTISFKPTTTRLSISPQTFAHGTAIMVNTTVAPASGSGTPTGSVAMNSTDATAYSDALGLLTLSGMHASASIKDLPGGTYQVFGQYSGDGTWGASTSAPVTVTVTQEKDTLSTTGWVLNPADGNLYQLVPGMSIPYGSQVYLDTQPVGANEAQSAAQATPATGAIVFTDSEGSWTQNATVPLNAEGAAEWVPTVLPVGIHTIAAAYAGDASYNATSAAATATFTVFRGLTTMYLQPMETNVAAGSSVTVDVILQSGSLGLSGTLPTGSITVTLGNQSATVKSPFNNWNAADGTMQEAVVTFTNVPAGILPLSASYSGDANWNGIASFYGSVQSLAAKPAPAVTLSSSATSFLPNQTVALTGVVTGTTALGAPQGALVFTWADGSIAASGTLQQKTASSATWTLTLPAWKLANASNIFAATFGGDSNYSAQSSAPLVLTLNAGDFSVVALNQNVAITQGNTASGNITITPVNGYSGSVSVTCSAPAGITCTPSITSPAVGSGISDSIIFTVPGNLVTGTYPVVLTATGGGRTHTAGMLLAYAPSAATPAFFPPPGTYVAAQTVAISDTTPGAVVYYTVDGSTPTLSSPVYTAPVAISTNRTLSAMAIAPGYSASSTSSANYTIAPPVATPVFSLASGTYSPTQTVTISDATAGATIYYTTDGSTPTASSTQYTTPIIVRSTETIEATAVAGGYTNSPVGSETYVIASPQTPLQFIPVTPCRIADTRNPNGPFGGPALAGNSTREFDIPQSGCNIPATALAYSLNITVVPNPSLGYLSVWPSGQTQPLVSTLNSDGRVKANAAVTPAGSNGGVNVYVSDASNVILDIDGYFMPANTASALAFYPLAPCRVADTRNAAGALGGPYIAGSTSRAFPVQSSNCKIPASARAYSLNFTAVPHGGLGYLSTWPTGQAQPYVSTLNASTGEVTANAAIVPAGTNGEISIYVSDDSDVVLDISGYFAPPASGGLSLYSATPCRIVDTRQTAEPFPGTLLVPVENSACAVPSAAAAYVLNATVVPTGFFGYLSLWAGGQSQPFVSTLNATDGTVTSNMAIVPTVNGSVDSFSQSAGNLILDISSYFAP